MQSKLPKLPYGVGDYVRIRESNMLYVDKTQFIAQLADYGQYLFFLRPRRSGKSLMISTMMAYYDQNFAQRFESLFAQTWIGQNPTPEKNAYLVLSFNFAEVRPEPQDVEASFEQYLVIVLRDFVKRYTEVFDEEFSKELQDFNKAPAMLSSLFKYCSRKQHKLCILIDEYDNFTNTILTTYGKDAYHRITHGSGFFRSFFNSLKGGTSMADSPVARMFITGVSPVTMDDVTSGFNIGIQISQYPELQSVAGFTQSEVKHLVTENRTAETLGLNLDQVLGLLEEWYGGYRFTRRSQDFVYNPDMILYFLNATKSYQSLPDDLTDQNVRIDFGKLRHLLLADSKLNGNFNILKSIMEEGSIASEIVTGFPIEQLKTRHNFVSLLYYFGLITHSNQQSLEPSLVPPNRTIKGLIWKQIRDAYEVSDAFHMDVYVIEQSLNAMATRGDFKPFFDHFSKALSTQTGIRDYIDGEKFLQGFLLAYLNTRTYYRTFSEKELNKGYCDLVLEPFLEAYPIIKFGYLIELKFIKRKDSTKALLEEKINAGKAQLAQYKQDPWLLQHKSISWRALLLVFHGWELIYTESC